MEFNPAILERIRILELVDEQIGKSVRLNLAALHTRDGQSEHVLEIDLAVSRERFLVGVVKLRIGGAGFHPPKIRLDALDNRHDFFWLPRETELGYHPPE
jgi:hypothetical protein